MMHEGLTQSLEVCATTSGGWVFLLFRATQLEFSLQAVGWIALDIKGTSEAR